MAAEGAMTPQQSLLNTIMRPQQELWPMVALHQSERDSVAHSIRQQLPLLRLADNLSRREDLSSMSRYLLQQQQQQLRDHALLGSVPSLLGAERMVSSLPATDSTVTSAATRSSGARVRSTNQMDLTRQLIPDSHRGASLEKKRTGGVVEPFPQKLYRMLEEAETEGFDDVVSFFEHGQTFRIHKPRKFVSDIMPRYFTTKRLSSFQRQLNLYGFKRIVDGKEKNGYYHADFVKGQEERAERIRRKRTSLPETSSEPLAVVTTAPSGVNPQATSLLDAARLSNLRALQQLLVSGAVNPLSGAGAPNSSSLGGGGGVSGLSPILSAAMRFPSAIAQPSPVMQLLLQQHLLQQQQQSLAAAARRFPILPSASRLDLNLGTAAARLLMQSQQPQPNSNLLLPQSSSPSASGSAVADLLSQIQTLQEQQQQQEQQQDQRIEQSTNDDNEKEQSKSDR